MPDQSEPNHDLQLLRRRVKRQQSLFEAQERKRLEEEKKLVQEYLDYLREKKLRQQQERQQRLAQGRLSLARRKAAEAQEVSEAPSSPQKLTEGGSTCSLSAEGREEPKEKQKETKLQIEESFTPAKIHNEIPEKVAKLYRKFRGPLMLKYLKELAANDQVSGWRLDELLSVQPSKVEAESERPEKETKRCWSHQARKQRLRMMHQVATEVLNAKRELGHCFADSPPRIAA